MLGNPRLTRKYANEYAMDVRMDKFVFMPPPGVTLENSDAVVIGDSFAESAAIRKTLSPAS